MKILIMTDLEGISGVNGRSDGIGNKTINKEAAERLLTEEVNAVVEGLVSAGADDVAVFDGHGGSDSILIENLHPAAKLLTWGAQLAPVTAFDTSYDAAMLIGIHAMAGVADGYMNHTFNSHSEVGMWLNGKPAGEIAMFVLEAAYFRVPTILVSGDRAACREAKTFMGKVELVETKTAFGRYAVLNENPVTVRTRLKDAAQRALLARSEFPIKAIRGSYELKVRLMCPNLADAHEMRGARRLDPFTVLYVSDDFIDLWAQYIGWAPGRHNRRFGIRQPGIVAKHVTAPRSAKRR